MRKRSPAGRKRSSFASLAGASEPTSSPLNASVDRLVDERRRLVDRGFAPPTSSARARRGSGRATASVRRSATPSRATRPAGAASTAVARADGMTSRPSRTTTCARRGFGSAAETRAATSSSSGRATSTWSTTRVGGLGSTSVRIRPTKLVRPASQSACCGRRGVDAERLGRLDVVRLPADDDAHRRLQLRLAELDARQRPVPVVRVARAHGGHGRTARQASTTAVMNPARLTICKVAAAAGLHSFP